MIEKFKSNGYWVLCYDVNKLLIAEIGPYSIVENAFVIRDRELRKRENFHVEVAERVTVE